MNASADQGNGAVPQRASTGRSDAARVGQALAERPQARVLLDFDHTLFASNSTERFIQAAVPSLIVSLVLLLVRLLLPARVLKAHAWQLARDRWRVLLIVLVTPWNLWRWRRRAHGLWARHSDHPLARELAAVDPQRVVIVSFGFEAVIGPMLAGSRWADCPRVCTPLWHLRGPARRGKLDMVRQVLTDDELRGAIFVTDSLHDADLLDQVASPHLVQPAGQPVDGGRLHYLPGAYAFGAKFERRHALDQVVFVDLAIALLAVSGGPGVDATRLLGALLLFASYLAVYDIGYQENDQLAARREAHPAVRAGAAALADPLLVRRAWAWALVLAVAGSLVLQFGTVPGDAGPLGTVATLGRWMAVLLFTRAVYAVYNRLAPAHRVLPYAGLQIAKSLGLFVVLPVAAAGVALGVAQATMMWVKYLVYRRGSRAAANALPKGTVRLVVFGALACAWLVGAGMAGHDASLLPWCPALLWCGWRAHGGVVKRWLRSGLARHHAQRLR
ncbi:haloacid dehalogenase-like hydrolase [Ideonella sp. A 288]|uniref:haloacid dehalogenase-like hydrolase n=1 Tax=Ideonella sp. A 288 TaxID=1962181 RepID=UPI001303AAF8|nr:hypothetical protein [Ideonella sp. A 288]